MKKRTNFYLLILALSYMMAFSCEKLIDIPASKSQIETTAVFADSTTAASALLNIYSTFGGAVNNGNKFLALYTDDYFHTAPGTGNLLQFNQARLAIDNSDSKSLWNNLYSCIYQCNAVIKGTGESTGLSPNAKKQLAAEAKFLRAFSYLQLINIYDHISLLLGTDVNINRVATQSENGQVYSQILSDLTSAQADLQTAYPGTEKVRANRASATALLARAYLYLQDWTSAAKESSQLISAGNYSPLPAAENAFQAGSREAILQFWSNNGFVGDVSQLIPASSTTIPAYTLSNGLYRAYLPGDLRKSKWIGTNTVTQPGGTTVSYYYPAKYKNRTAGSSRPEYTMALRLAEQYLIRAEALAQQDQVPAAIADLNIIRLRAGLNALPADLPKTDCLVQIATERRLELFGEWGLRFFDLKRTGQLERTMSALKPTWKAYGKAFPIPNTEIIYNSNLIQNEGY